MGKKSKSQKVQTQAPVTQPSSMPETIGASGHVVVLCHLIGEDTIAAWFKENVVWPGLTIFAATVCYTVGVNRSAGRDLADWHVCGELVGAGGMFLVVVMLASTFGRLEEWHRLALACPGSNEKEEPKACLKAVESTKRGMVELQIVAALGAVVFAGLQILIEHLPAASDRFALSLTLLSASLGFVLSASLFCRWRLLKALQGIMSLERCLAGHRFSVTGPW